MLTISSQIFQAYPDVINGDLLDVLRNFVFQLLNAPSMKKCKNTAPKDG